MSADANRVLFTADMHYGHARVIQYAKRPFATVDEMDDEMIRNWCAVVRADDEVYIVGDVSFHKKVDRTIAIVNQLPGRKSLVFGNHDKKLRKERRFLDLFEHASDMMEVKIQDKDARDGVQRIVLLHYAMRVWNKSHFGAWQLYGHSHGSLADDPCALSLDVGVDCWNFTPVTYEQVKAKMAMKKFVPVDHHGSDRGEE